MPETWMKRLMLRTTAKGQTVDDLLRRSAGIPAAFIAIFLSEPEGALKKLLPRALKWPIGVASTYLCNNSDEGLDENEDMSNERPMASKLSNGEPKTIADKLSEENISKIRDEGVVPTVHAFNVLKAAFNDTNLATNTTGFCAEAMIALIRYFSSPYWEVRNGACLAYTALVRCMIEFFNVQKCESARRALTGVEFFHRYPALHPFFFSELKVATEFLSDKCSTNTESNISKAIHPSLCPILILLTRLKPAVVSSGSDDALDPFVFVPFLRKCATQSNFRVRVLASRALTGLVSSEKLPTVINAIAHGLPDRGHWMLGLGAYSASTDVVANTCSNPGTSTCAIPFNSIHGLLLQLFSLLDNNCIELSDASTKAHIVDELIQVLLKCAWIGSIRSCPCPTLNSSFIQVLDSIHSIAKTCISRNAEIIAGLLLELASESLDARNSGKLMWTDPTLVELRKQAASSYFNCLFGESHVVPDEEIQLFNVNLPSSSLPEAFENRFSETNLQERLKSCISDPLYEVRHITLKKILQFVTSLSPDQVNDVVYIWAKANLHPLLIEMLSAEENPKCIYYVLRIIFSWNLLQVGTPTDSINSGLVKLDADCNFLFSFYDRLSYLYGTLMRVKTREIILCCMGLCVKHLSKIMISFFSSDRHIVKELDIDSRRIYEEFSRAFRSIDSFIILVKHHSAPSEPVNMRRAVAEAIIASGLLEEATTVASFVSNSLVTFDEQLNHGIDEILSQYDMSQMIDYYASKILELWFTCTQLLEDEDVDLRQKLAKNVQSCINSRISSKCSHADSVPTQVDRVIQSGFDFLSSSFGHWLGYLNYLSRWILVSSSPPSSCGDLVRRIFDKEIDNHHEEKLLISQICCLNLEKLAVSMSTQVHLPQLLQERGIYSFSWVWGFRFLRQLKSFINSYLENEGKLHWIGGVGNHKDAFVPVYANLLGLYALSQCQNQVHASHGHLTDDLKLYSKEFVELGTMIGPFCRNPLISSMYQSILQQYKCIFGPSQIAELPAEHLCNTSFDPYFLLR